MKIQELVLRHDLETNYDPRNILVKHGWKVIGSGLGGAVAQHPNRPYVIKLYRNSSRYSQFVEFVQNHQPNPYLPRFNRYVRNLPGDGRM